MTMMTTLLLALLASGESRIPNLESGSPRPAEIVETSRALTPRGGAGGDVRLDSRFWILDSSARAVAKLSVIIGPVETKVGEAGAYAPAVAGADLEADMFVKTGAGGRAALDFADGSELRLHENTELHVQGPRKASLKLGSYYAVIKKGDPVFEVVTPFAPMKAAEAVYAASFEKRDPNDPLFKTVSRTETKIAVFESKVQVVSRRYAQYVTAGYSCNLVDAQLNTPDPTLQPMLGTRWTHPILVARGKSSDETSLRANAMLDRLGMVEKDDPSEAGMRELGEFAAPTLTMYLKTPGGASELPRRRAAARVLGDVAKNPLDLLPALRDPDAQVRISAARGLKRLTGEDLGKDEAFWSGDQAATEGWKAWDEKLRKK